MTELRKISIPQLGEFVEEFKEQFDGSIDVDGQTIPLIFEANNYDQDYTIKLMQNAVTQLPNWLQQAWGNILGGVLDRHNNSCHKNNGADVIGVKITKDNFVKSTLLKKIIFVNDTLGFYYESGSFPEEVLFVIYYELCPDFDYFAEDVDLEELCYPYVGRSQDFPY